MRYYYLSGISKVFLLLCLPGYLFAQQQKDQEVIDWGWINGEGTISLYEDFLPHLDSAHIPFAYNILFEKKLEYQEIQEKVLLKKRNKTIYCFDSLENFRMVTNQKQFYEDNIVCFMLNHKRYDLIDLYRKYAPDYQDEEHLPVALQGTYSFNFHHKKYLYLQTGYVSNLSILSLETGSFLFDVTDSSNIIFIPVEFEHGGTTPLCFGDIDGDEELDFISLNGSQIYELKNNQFVPRTDYYLIIDDIEINHAPVPDYLFLIDLTYSRWSFELRDRWKAYGK